jgi:hypothetical protein
LAEFTSLWYLYLYSFSTVGVMEWNGAQCLFHSIVGSVTAYKLICGVHTHNCVASTGSSVTTFAIASAQVDIYSLAGSIV